MQHANQLLYASQMKSIETAIKAVESRVSKLRQAPSWTAVQQAEASVDKLEERLPALQSAWSSYIVNMVNSEDMVRVTTDGRRKVRDIVEQIGELRRQIFEVHPEDNVTPSPSSHQVTENANAPRGSRPKIKLDTLTIPPFDGNVLSYPEFKMTFKALTDPDNHTPAVLLIYLRNALPKEAKELLLGAYDMELAWQRLDEMYGDVQQRTLAIYQKLQKLELRGRDYEKVEKLHREVEHAQHLLETTGDQQVLVSDMFIVNALLAKLSHTWLDKWLEYKLAEAPNVKTGVDEWPVFRTWLKKCSKLAIMARVANTSGLRAPTSAPSTPAAKLASRVVCSRCRLSGHRAADCPEPGTTAELNAAILDDSEMQSTTVAFASSSEREQRYKDTEARFGKCPLCNSFHT